MLLAFKKQNGGAGALALFSSLSFSFSLLSLFSKQLTFRRPAEGLERLLLEAATRLDAQQMFLVTRALLSSCLAKRLMPVRQRVTALSLSFSEMITTLFSTSQAASVTERNMKKKEKKKRRKSRKERKFSAKEE